MDFSQKKRDDWTKENKLLNKEKLYLPNKSWYLLKIHDTR